MQLRPAVAAKVSQSNVNPQGVKMFKRLLVAGAMLLSTLSYSFAADPVKVGFIYVGPIGDHGWTYRHDIGRQQVEEAFGDKVETSYIESVQYGPEAESVIRQMAQDHDIIFATSFGYMNEMLKVAKDFPDVKFEHATGYKQSDNMASYGLRLYQARHVQGIIAGMMTKTNKICYVGAYPIPEVIREINTFFLGARSMNPDVDIDIVWVNTWYDPVKEADAAKVHIAEGADVLAQHTDSPAMLQIAEKNGAMGFGQSTDMSAFAPKAQLFASINNWGPYYIKKIEELRNGKWNTGDGPNHWPGNVWGGIKSDMLVISKFQNMPANVAQKAQEALDGIKTGKINIFAGPLIDNTGKEIIPAGKALDDGALWGMNYYLQGVNGKVPG